GLRGSPPALLFSTGRGAPPPRRTDADAAPRIYLSSASHGRRRSPPALPALRCPIMAAMPRWLRVVALVLFAATGASAQYDRPGVPGYRTDVKYDGRFTFVRVAWKT